MLIYDADAIPWDGTVEYGDGLPLPGGGMGNAKIESMAHYHIISYIISMWNNLYHDFLEFRNGA